MKVLLLNTSEKTGGAAIACHRLMNALNTNGVEAKMLVRDKQTDNPSVYTINTSSFRKIINKWRFMWERFVIFACNHFSKKNLFSVSIANTGTNISKHPLVKEADIIHFHWINQGFLSIKDIVKLTHLGKPIVWTMHDQWPYTGLCHYVGDCDRFANHCSECPQMNQGSLKDKSYKTFNKKKNFFAQNNVTLVGCSNWIANQASQSSLLGKTNITSIPNPIDLTLYHPTKSSDSRKLFRLPDSKKLILYGACKATDKRKGVDFLISACEQLSNSPISSRLALVVFGAQSEELSKLINIPVINVGYINGAEQMVQLYNAVDLFLIPSLEDNLPNTIMEAMACGTPCVGFNTGGIPEMIDHRTNGYVANYKDAEDLANGIHWVLEDADYAQLSQNARKKVEEHYSETIVARMYKVLYGNLIENNKR